MLVSAAVVNTSPGSRKYYKGSLSVNQRSVIAARIDIMARIFLAKIGVTHDTTRPADGPDACPALS